MRRVLGIATVAAFVAASTTSKAQTKHPPKYHGQIHGQEIRAKLSPEQIQHLDAANPLIRFVVTVDDKGFGIACRHETANPTMKIAGDTVSKSLARSDRRQFISAREGGRPVQGEWSIYLTWKGLMTS